MNADSSRRIELTLHHLKLFAKVDILYILQNFFTDCFPDYTHREEKPSGYDADPANYARQEYIIDLRDSLICLEQTNF